VLTQYTEVNEHGLTDKSYKILLESYVQANGDLDSFINYARLAAGVLGDDGVIMCSKEQMDFIHNLFSLLKYFKLT
jgi:hypothetical protein